MILAIDPGLAFIGLALVSEEGELLEKATVKLGGKMDPDERLRALKAGLLDFLDGEDELVVVLEAYACYGLKGAITNAFQMGRITQAIVDLCDQVLGVPHEIVPAREARKFVTDNPNAKSPQIREGLRLLGYDMRMNDHERDALALALCWLDQQRRKAATR